MLSLSKHELVEASRRNHTSGNHARPNASSNRLRTDRLSDVPRQRVPEVDRARLAIAEAPRAEPRDRLVVREAREPEQIALEQRAPRHESYALFHSKP